MVLDRGEELERQNKDIQKPNSWIRLKSNIVNAEPIEMGVAYNFVYLDGMKKPIYFLRLNYEPAECRSIGPILAHISPHASVSLNEIVLGELLSIEEDFLHLGYDLKPVIEKIDRRYELVRYLSRRQIPLPSEFDGIWSELKHYVRVSTY